MRQTVPQHFSTQGEFAKPADDAADLPFAGSFDELDIPEALLSVRARNNVASPFPIQAATLLSALTGRDVLGRGRTGSGKTLAFGLAVLARPTGCPARPRRPLAVVTPAGGRRLPTASGRAPGRSGVSLAAVR